MTKAAKPFDKEAFFAALADKTRLRLLNLIGDTEVCVCYFVEVLGAPQPKISRHLAYLRRAGIVSGRREGTWVHYRIVRPEDPDAARILDEVMAWLAKDPAMQLDHKQLSKVCCAPQLPVQLRGAPKPSRVIPESASLS